ncbi:hypothetical protein JCM10207_001541 [Rhodosporidiobolus poonsookiae]
MAYPSPVHSHPLTFALSALDKLDSLALSTIAFHLDYDQPGFAQVLEDARREWHARRERALGQGATLEAAPAPLSSSSSAGSSSNLNNGTPSLSHRLGTPPAAPAVPHVFVPLVETLRRLHRSSSHKPIKANLGSEMRQRFPDVFSRQKGLDTFKTYVAEAERMGMVTSARTDTQGKDTIVLNEPWRSGRFEQPVPPAPAPIPTPPLSPASFHLSSLEFPWSADALAALPSHRLLLLQFRKDVPDSLASAIDEEFWRRRAESVAAGEQWQPPDATADLPAASSPPGLDKRQRLPRALTAQLHNLDVSNLPPSSISTVSALTQLLPPHLAPLAAVIYAPAPSSSSTTSSSSPPPPARRAHLAYLTSGLAGAAQALLNALRPVEDGVAFAVRAAPVGESGEAPGWEWGDVREQEREAFWRRYRAQEGEGKRAREDEDVKGSKKARTGSEKPPQAVSPDSLVPTSLLSSLYCSVFHFDKTPIGVRDDKACDDAFVHRFNAAGWRYEHEPKSSVPLDIYVLFRSRRAQDRFGDWVTNFAARYWKQNATSVSELDIRDIQLQRGEWRFRDFSPDWREEHNLVVEPASTPTVGQLGCGRDVPRDVEAGWFEWEYKFNNRPKPAAPGSLAARMSTWKATGAGGGADGASSSGGFRSRSPSVFSTRTVDTVPTEDSALAPAPAPAASRLPPSLRSAEPAPTLAASSVLPSPPLSHSPAAADEPVTLPPWAASASASGPVVRGENSAAPFALSPDPVVPMAIDEAPSASGSILASARLSPTLSRSFSNTSTGTGAATQRSRRPTASEMIELDQDLDALFEEAGEHVGAEVDSVKIEEGDDDDVRMSDDAQVEAAGVKLEQGDAHEPVSSALVAPVAQSSPAAAPPATISICGLSSRSKASSPPKPSSSPALSFTSSASASHSSNSHPSKSPPSFEIGAAPLRFFAPSSQSATPPAPPKPVEQPAPPSVPREPHALPARPPASLALPPAATRF